MLQFDSSLGVFGLGNVLSLMSNEHDEMIVEIVLSLM